VQIVTLTTDWGLSDYYIGIVKGRLYSLLNDVLVVDITHNIEDYNLLKTAFIVKNACSQYPEGTIHLIDVNSYEEGEANGSKPKPYVVVKHKNQYYICTDNGLPSMIFGNDEVEITDVNLYNETDYYTFAALDLFPKVVKMIAENHSIDYIGNKMKSFYNVSPQKHYITQNNNSILIAQVTYVDKYGNVFLNAKDSDFNKIRNNRSFKILVGGEYIENISLSYADVELCRPLLTISSSGYLQLALREGNFSRLLGVRTDDSIKITFSE
jgi:S-adenosylmethionine hydrolase